MPIQSRNCGPQVRDPASSQPGTWREAPEGLIPPSSGDRNQCPHSGGVDHSPGQALAARQRIGTAAEDKHKP